MSKNTISPLTLEKLHCSVCTGYLSCSPVRLLPDGSCICGCCSPPNSNVPIYRALPLEAILTDIQFPCRFKRNGCTEMVLFGQTTEHESKCTYQDRVCPMLLQNCVWKGSAMKINGHFSQKHPSFIKQAADLKLKLIECSQGVFMVNKDSVGFIIKYSYDNRDKHLKYDVRYCENPPKYNVTFKISLYNDSDRDCSINLQSKKCFSYDNTFYGMENALDVNLNKFLESLDDPEVMTVVFQLVVVQTITNDVNLAYLKCGNCGNYLIPPLFDIMHFNRLEPNVVCYKCGVKDSSATKSKNTKLIEQASKTEFPCYWQNCNFLGKSDTYRAHESSCTFRVYKCIVCGCNESFKLTGAAAHYRNCHNFAYYDPYRISYEIVLPAVKIHKTFCTIKNDEIIVIKHFSQDNKYKMSLTTSAQWVLVHVQFVEQHGYTKSEKFSLKKRKGLTITLDHLPSSFTRNEKFKVNVTDILF